MQVHSGYSLINELADKYDFVELHEGALPYDEEVLTQESVLEGSKASIFSRIMEWLGPKAFTKKETNTLAQDYWLMKPGFLLEAFSQCKTGKGIVVDKSSDAYFYLLTTQVGPLRTELTWALQNMLRTDQVRQAKA